MTGALSIDIQDRQFLDDNEIFNAKEFDLLLF